MKKILVILGFAVSACLAQDKPKLWVHNEYQQHGDRVVFIEDLETGTRCYAITNDRVNGSGYAISCVPKK